MYNLPLRIQLFQKVFQSLSFPPQHRLPEEIRLIIRHCRRCAWLKCLLVDNKWRRGLKPQQGHFRLQLPLGFTLPPAALPFCSHTAWNGSVWSGLSHKTGSEHSISSLPSLAPLWTVKPARATESRTEQRYTRGSRTTKGGMEDGEHVHRWISKNKDNMGEPPQWGLHTVLPHTTRTGMCFKGAFTKMSFHLPFLSAVKETSQCRASVFVVSF